MRIAGAAVLICAVACIKSRPSLAHDGGAPAVDRAQVIEWVYDGKLAHGWHDFGYAPHGRSNQGPQELDLSGYSGWILARRGLEWERLGALTCRHQTRSDDGDFLEVKLATGDEGDFPKVVVTARHCAMREGWHEVVLPMELLNPGRAPFDRIRFKAIKNVPKDWVRFDRIGFLAAVPAAEKPALPARDVVLSVDCEAKGHRISRYVYGIASSHKLDTPFTELGATIGRWGGNTSSRYNWRLGNTWNAGSDWYFKNVDYSGRPGFSWRDELEHNLSKGAVTALTVPMLGWVARDTKSYSFPVSELGAQADADGDAGNGMGRDGKTKIPAGPPTRTSVASTPGSIAEWVKAIRALDQKRGKRSVAMYFLDNEPGLWHDTHRDVHPEPLSYEELLEKTIAYGTAVRRADPEALIAGPAEWGWTGYLYSARDLEAGWRVRPDRRAHGDVPLIEWYLRKLAEHEKKTGVRVLDVLDLHFYPQAKGIGLQEKGQTDPATSALRIRSTRALWDETYVDESWIGEAVALLPRMKRWVAENYPSLKISIGEYNWGAEGHMSGGLALAEVLGRFGQYDVFSAFYWRYPKPGTPAWFAFRAYGNYDGQGARFPDWSVPAKGGEDVSVFAARDEDGKRLVLVALNLDPDRPAKASLALNGCGDRVPSRWFVYAVGSNGLELRKVAVPLELPAYSISVIELVAGPKE